MILSETDRVEDQDLPPEVVAPSMSAGTGLDWIQLPDEGVEFEQLERRAPALPLGFSCSCLVLVLVIGFFGFSQSSA